MQMINIHAKCTHSMITMPISGDTVALEFYRHLKFGVNALPAFKTVFKKKAPS